MKKIAIFYHTCFFKPPGTPGAGGPWARSTERNEKYMRDLTNSGLLDAADLLVAGINGGEESAVYAKLTLPRAQHRLWGLDCLSSNLTSDAMRTFAAANPGYAILHFHCKGIAHGSPDTPDYDSYLEFEGRWIKCMVENCIYQWRRCVADLENFDSVGCHWMEKVGNPPVDHIWGGTFFWLTSEFCATLPPLSETPLVKQFGLRSYESRATSEQYIGLGPKLPKIKDYHVNGIGSCP